MDMLICNPDFVLAVKRTLHAAAGRFLSTAQISTRSGLKVYDVQAALRALRDDSAWTYTKYGATTAATRK